MLELYHKTYCPYSAKVRDFIDQKGLRSQIQYHEVTEEPGAEEKLEQLTGKSQVPCLVIDGEPLLESDEIIEFLAHELS